MLDSKRLFVNSSTQGPDKLVWKQLETFYLHFVCLASGEFILRSSQNCFQLQWVLNCLYPPPMFCFFSASAVGMSDSECDIFNQLKRQQEKAIAEDILGKK